MAIFRGLSEVFLSKHCKLQPVVTDAGCGGSDHPVGGHDTAVAVHREILGNGGSHSRQRDVPDVVHHSKGRLISSFSSPVLFSPSHLPGRTSYYFLQSEMGGDVCSGNSSHIPDKVTIPSPTFRQWNIKVERSIIWRSQLLFFLKKTCFLLFSSESLRKCSG